MKKLLMAFVTAALLTVCFCVPAFAFDYPCVCRDKDVFHYFYDETFHYVFCPGHQKYTILTDDDGDPLLHSGSGCDVCAEYDTIPFCYTFTKGLEGALLSGNVGGYFDSADHYVFCYDCGLTLTAANIYAYAVPHTGESCQLCSEFKAYGLTVYDAPPGSESIVASISPLVTNAIEWVSLVANCIVNEPLLLLFVCVSFVGIGIGFIKRIIHL